MHKLRPDANPFIPHGWRIVMAHSLDLVITGAGDERSGGATSSTGVDQGVAASVDHKDGKIDLCQLIAREPSCMTALICRPIPAG